MSHLDLVRTEIKSWERDFASRHGRDPSVEDIKAQPRIAEKYKLYKKLAKAATLPKSRPADTVPPLPGFNPFSPAKKTAALRQSSTLRTTPRANPFATPTKNNAKPRPRTVTPSPDSPHPSPSAPLHNLPVSTTAVSRARKRLRGEPVSPSPDKPKRQRIRSQALPRLPRSEQDSSNSEYEADHELPLCDFTSSFVADSPVKAPAGGRSFKLLFDDALPALSIPRKSIAQIDSPPNASSTRASANPSRERESAPSPKGFVSGTQHRIHHAQSNIFITNDHLPASSHRPIQSMVVSGVSRPPKSMKRALDCVDPAGELQRIELGSPSQPQYSLVPPSPPPQDLTNRDAGKAKAKAIASRKKLKVEDEDEEDEGADSPDDVSLKVATVSLDRDRCPDRHVDDFDWDPLLHLGTWDRNPSAKQQIDGNHHALGTFSVDLPDRFRRVLAISPSRSRNNTEERVVRGLLFGDRVGHYDPSRGGDIWDAGETVETTNGDIETEDDWEGEPVPWEVGEL